MKEIIVLSPVGMLGYGFPGDSFQEGLKKEPNAIAVDAGSTDAGPHKLGAGVGIVSKEATKRDLTHMLTAGCEKKIPVLVGSAGGSGAETHVNWTLEIVREIAKEKNLHFKMAVIHSDIEKTYIKRKIAEGKVKPLGPVPELKSEEVDKAIRIVAVMGIHPHIKALEEGAGVIIAGRSNDPAMFAALPIKEGYDPGLALHMGKILECGAMASTPGTTSDCMMGYLRDDYFIVEPTNLKRKCIPSTVAAHTLYEKSSPLHIIGPEGLVDITQCKFEQYSERAVKVSGSKLKKSETYFVKLEGAAKVAYRTISIAGVRDPIMIRQIKECERHVRETVPVYFNDISIEDYQLIFHIYGKNGVMGELEPQKEITSHELCLILEVVAKNQELANTICAFARSTLMHYSYKGRIATAGNLAFPYAPSDIPTGAVYKFNIHHLVEVDDPGELFRIEYINV